AGRALLERAGDAPSIGAALGAAEEWALARLRKERARDSPVRPALDLIRAAGGQIRMEDAARALGWSRRRLERGFQRALGISPKRYARIVRLNGVLASLDGEERVRAVDLALDAGFFDQAHLARDLRGLAGATPRSARPAGELARQFQRPERLRALLLPE